MITINTSSWHYRLLKTANIDFPDPRWRSETISLDMVDWSKQSSCSYIGYLFKAFAKLFALSALTYVISYSLTHFIITVLIAGFNQGFNSSVVDNGGALVDGWFNIATYVGVAIIGFIVGCVVIGCTALLVAGLIALGFNTVKGLLIPYPRDKSTEELAKSWWHKYCTKIEIKRDNDRYQTFKEFYWKLYLKEHENKTSRILHFIGTTAAIALLIAAAITHVWWYALGALFTGYGFAWVGHFFFEKNRPATFKYPLYSLAGDFRLWFELLTRQKYFNWAYKG